MLLLYFELSCTFPICYIEGASCSSAKAKCLGLNTALFKDKLESVQEFATEVITKQWHSHYNDCLRLPNLP